MKQKISALVFCSAM